jgi:hypothetical protein
VYIARYGVYRHANSPHVDTIIHLAFGDGWAYTSVHLEFVYVPTTLQSSIPWLHMHMECVRGMYTSGDTVHLASRFGECRHASPPLGRYDQTLGIWRWKDKYIRTPCVHICTNSSKKFDSLVPYAFGMNTVYVE